MIGLGTLFALLAGVFCLGAAFIVALIFAMAARNSGDTSDGCLGKYFTIVGILLALFFFYIAIFH